MTDKEMYFTQNFINQMFSNSHFCGKLQHFIQNNKSSNKVQAHKPISTLISQISDLIVQQTHLESKSFIKDFQIELNDLRQQINKINFSLGIDFNRKMLVQIQSKEPEFSSDIQKELEIVSKNVTHSLEKVQFFNTSSTFSNDSKENQKQKQQQEQQEVLNKKINEQLSKLQNSFISHNLSFEEKINTLMDKQHKTINNILETLNELNLNEKAMPKPSKNTLASSKSATKLKFFLGLA